MAAVLKHWREAATLILVCSNPGITGGSKVVTSKPTQPHKLKTSFDYRILMLKRSGKSAFMPNAYVFPGGVASDADFSSEWSDMFRSSGIDLSKWPTALSSSVVNPDCLSPMLTRQRDKQFSAIPADVAFRICAIRETFEESGVLLVRDASSAKLSEAVSNFSVRASLCGKLEEESLMEWRHLVQKDATEFLRLCKEYKFLPDVWSLYDWSNWLTPVTRMMSGKNQPKRFDTAFYLSVVDELPEFVKHDAGETVHTQWSSPAEVIQSFRAKTCWIAPPQLYELARLIQFSSACEIAEFVNQRSKYHMKRWMPVSVTAKDGTLHTFAGDCLFPANVNWINPFTCEELEKSTAELEMSSPLNRIYLKSMFDLRLKCDLDQFPEHISPLSEDELASLDVLDENKPSANL